ncbi:MAG: IS1 family transposase [Terracidiphilus sp.]
MTGAAKHTVLKLQEEIGCACAAYHHRHVRGLKARRIQCDEIWQLAGAKQKNTTSEQKAAGWCDAWTWTAIDAETRLCISYPVGGRDTGRATDFAFDIRERVVGRPQITADAHKPCPAAIEMASGKDVDYAQMHEIYGASGEPETRYSPAKCIGCDMKTVIESPDYEHVTTSYVERQNLAMRMQMRRFTRLTNGFSKKIEDHGHAVALHFMYYNLVRAHMTLRVTPAMEAGIAHHVWSMEELVSLLDTKAKEKAA